MTHTLPKDSQLRLSPHFMAREFRCPCSHCTEIVVEQELVDKLEAMRLTLGVPMFITSAYRCAAYQDDLRARGFETAKGISQHQLGRAADVMTKLHSGPQLEQVADEAGFDAIGVGKRFVHVDLRKDKPNRRWTYSY